MIFIYWHIALSFYLLGRAEGRGEELKTIDHMIIWLWLPVIVAFLSIILAKKVFGDAD